MARQKQATPLRRETSSEYFSKADTSGTPSRNPRSLDRETNTTTDGSENGHVNGLAVPSIVSPVKKDAGIPQLLIAVGGIYVSFLTWALLQERLTTTSYGPPFDPEHFTFPVFLNTIQSLFAALMGFLYLYLTTSRGTSLPPIIPSRGIIAPLLAVSLTSSLASPFGYASLAHIDYITFILAKSCKLLPVMFLHITLFQKRYPLYKYLVVLSVTAGVAVFTLHAQSAKAHKTKSHDVARNPVWGLTLLGINLLLDGLTNTTQDYIFTTFRGYSGPQMMCANNLIGSAITIGWLAISPLFVHTGIGQYLGMDLASGGGGEFAAALAFMGRHPRVWLDVLGFAACGAVGQVFIFYTLSTFSSVLLVTVTVTRKMFTMILSVLWFGHSLSAMQWAGVSLVFGGVGVEGLITRQEKAAKDAAKKAAVKLDSKKEL